MKNFEFDPIKSKFKERNYIKWNTNIILLLKMPYKYIIRKI